MFYPQFEKTVGHIPDDISIPEWIFANRLKNGNDIAFIDSVTDQKRTWAEAISVTRQLARGLAKVFNITVGDENCFGLFTPNVGCVIISKTHLADTG